MNNSEKEISARKQIAMAAANFFVNEGYRHVAISMTSFRAEVTLFLDSADEATVAEQLSRPFIIDEASTKIGDGCTAAGDHYYYVTLAWL